jgi:hypothetical protein
MSKLTDITSQERVEHTFHDLSHPARAHRKGLSPGRSGSCSLLQWSNNSLDVAKQEALMAASAGQHFSRPQAYGLIEGLSLGEQSAAARLYQRLL